MSSVLAGQILLKWHWKLISKITSLFSLWLLNPTIGRTISLKTCPIRIWRQRVVIPWAQSSQLSVKQLRDTRTDYRSNLSLLYITHFHPRMGGWMTVWIHKRTTGSSSVGITRIRQALNRWPAIHHHFRHTYLLYVVGGGGSVNGCFLCFVVSSLYLNHVWASIRNRRESINLLLLLMDPFRNNVSDLSNGEISDVEDSGKGVQATNTQCTVVLRKWSMGGHWMHTHEVDGESMLGRMRWKSKKDWWVPKGKSSRVRYVQFHLPQLILMRLFTQFNH